ncbi:MAG: 5'-nucleotidase C-terminal domain-containing protein [Candidatus Eisenbacteria bacterium]
MRPLALLLALAGLSYTNVAVAEETRVTLLHTTDVHGSLLPYDDLLSKPAPLGLAKIATLVKQVRGEGQAVLLFDNGDATAGSPMVSVWRRGDRSRPEPVTVVMNAMGYDAMAVGNHEFDFGPAQLEATRAAAKFPFLAANVVRSGTGAPAFPGTFVRQLPNGVRVGVIGLCTPAVPLMGDSTTYAGLVFLSPTEVAARELEHLRKGERCDIVVVLAHMGLEKDLRTGEPRKGEPASENWGWRLAYEVPGLDAVILGHTHQVIPTGEVRGTLVTQAGSLGQSLGRLDFTLTRDSPLSHWALTKREARVIAVTDTVATDPALAASLAPYAAATRAELDQVVGQARQALSAPFGRFSDNPLWRLVHQVQLDATGADVSLAAIFDPTQRIEAGPVRVRDLMRLYPYDNTLTVADMSGSDLKATLERSVRFFATYALDGGRSLVEPGMAGFNLDMAYGVEYEVDLTRPPGERILNLRRAGKPLQDGDRLRVVVNSYRGAGGGDFEEVRRARKPSVLLRPMPELLREYVQRTRVLDPQGEAAWTLLPDYIATPERSLIERLVKQGIAPREEVYRLGALEPARRSDLAYWLGRAFGWRPSRPSDVSAPSRVAPLELALDWSERAARAAGYAVPKATSDPSFRRSLTTGITVAGPGGGFAHRDTLTRAQWLGMVSNLRYPTVRVLETTDFHGAILPTSRERRSQRPIGGSVALAAAIERLRGENPEGTVLLDGGDMFQGTMISNLQFGRPVVEQMNTLRYTAGAIGNHEFDWTADTLERRVREMRFTELAANMIVRKTGKMPRWVRSDTTVTRRGVRVGVLGLAYPGTPRVTMPANVAHLDFLDDSTTAARIAPRLRQAGALLVVGVGHIPAETDSNRKASGDLARLLRVKGVDAWFGGHSHNVVDDELDGVPAMIAGSQGQWLAICDLVVDPVKKSVIEKRHRMEQVFSDAPEQDSAWTARVARWNERVAPIAAEVLGNSTVALHRNRPEATVGDFICDAMRAASGADIALQNPGGMRADMDAGPITRGRVYAMMPFDNTIVVLTLTGAEVRLVIEQSLRGDRVTQVSGIRFTYDADQPDLQRVQSITLADGSVFDETRKYKVAANNFMASGGDSYDALGKGSDRVETGKVIRAALEDYVRNLTKAGRTLDMKSDGRIQRVKHR